MRAHLRFQASLQELLKHRTTFVIAHRLSTITHADLHRPTPYNTYTIPGLPPTPIANPGRAALEAAVDPAPVDYLYFVGRGDGTHEFSRTLAAHATAVARYQRQRH